jgi:hypothetical protein
LAVLDLNKEIINRDYFEYTGKMVFSEVSNHLRELGENTGFILNDILFPIPPISIQIQKDNFNWGYKTLRSKTTTKVVSGRSSVGIQIKLLFNREMILMLHRLIIQIRNNPFVWVKNDYIKNSILEIDPNLAFDKNNPTNLFCTVVGFRISSYQAGVSSFEAELDLKYFNYYPYSPNLMFRKELESLLIPISDTYFSSFVFPVFDIKKLAQIRYTLTTQTRNQEATTETNPTSDSTKKESETYFTSMYRNLKKYNFSMSVREPYFSNVYVRYYNYLQIKSLTENFGINCVDQSIFNKEEMKVLESGLIGENFQNLVIGLHSAYLPEYIKIKLILKMLEKDLNMKIYYNQYYYLNLPGEVLKNYRLEILNDTEVISDPKEKKFRILENQKKIAQALIKISNKEGN